jgi:hypothetical protein
MKKLALFFALGCFALTLVADAAAPAARQRANTGAASAGGARQGTGAAASAQSSGGGTAVRQRAGAGGGTAAASGGSPVSARSGSVRPGMNSGGAAPTGGGKPVAARSGTVQPGMGAAPGAPKVDAARSGTNTSVIQKVPTVQGAANSAGLVNESCKERWFGCMDMFCILANESGMRCSCSNARKGFDSILKEIDDLDTKIRQYGTSALEKVQLSDDQRAYIDEQMKKADADMKIDVAGGGQAKGGRDKTRTSLGKGKNAFANLSSDIDPFGAQEIIEEPQGEDLSKFQGDELYNKSASMCRKQMAGCENDMQMLQTMYRQNIASDCKAYEIELKARQKKAAENYQVVQTAVREAALEKYEDQNKFDLGQCVVEFGKCMRTDDTCGSDWTKCATNTFDEAELRGNLKGAPQPWQIHGVVLSAMTRYNMDAKKIICENVLNQCVRVKDQVWDNFLKNVVADLRSAEIMSEAGSRVNCLTDISECIRDACVSQVDPNKDADMNACLTDRNIARSSCSLGKPGKLGINKCESMIGQGLWEYLDAKMSSMRIDACTDAVKAALEKDTNCGPKYANCVGLSVDQVLGLIVRSTAADSSGKTDTRGQNDTVLVACRNVETGANANYADAGASVEKIRPIIQGLLLTVMSAQDEACGEFVSQEMTRICGSTENCDSKFGPSNTDFLGTTIQETKGQSQRAGTSADTGGKICGFTTDTNITCTPQPNSTDKSVSVNCSGGTGDFHTNIQTEVNNLIKQVMSEQVKKCVFGNTSTQTGVRNAGQDTDGARQNLLDRSIATIVDSAINRALANQRVKKEEWLKNAGNFEAACLLWGYGSRRLKDGCVPEVAACWEPVSVWASSAMKAAGSEASSELDAQGCLVESMKMSDYARRQFSGTWVLDRRLNWLTWWFLSAKDVKRVTADYNASTKLCTQKTEICKVADSTLGCKEWDTQTETRQF